MSHTHDHHGHADSNAHAQGDFHPHVVPVKVLLTVFAILLVLTLLTVAVTKLDLGKLNIWIALGIAVLKAAVVAMYFMHLKYDRPFHAVILVVSLLFVALFIGSVLIDTKEYQPNLLGKPAAPEMP